MNTPLLDEMTKERDKYKRAYEMLQFVNGDLMERNKHLQERVEMLTIDLAAYKDPQKWQD